MKKLKHNTSTKTQFMMKVNTDILDHNIFVRQVGFVKFCVRQEDFCARKVDMNHTMSFWELMLSPGRVILKMCVTFLLRSTTYSFHCTLFYVSSKHFN